MADVTLKHVYKVYDGGVRAVNDFNLDIKDKEFVVFVGPSGCGKSTTLRMIAGLEEITAGQLFIDGELMNEVEPKNRDIAMVFQSYALYPHMTVYENMAFGLKLRHVPKEEIDQRVRAAAEILEISELLTRKPKALSGGQRQRVALGRTIVRDPKVFLLDEPLSNLDAKLRVSMRSEITKLHEKLQTTFIYVTHDQTEAMTMGNRIVVMKNGFIQQADTPISLFEDPSNLFVATFLGSPQMNIVEAELFEEKGQLKAILNGCENMVVTFPEIKAKQLANARYIGQKVLLGMRPEHARPQQGDLPVFVDVVEHLGDETIIYTKMENRKEQFIIKTPFNSKIRANENINIAFDMDHVYLFDHETHKAIMGIPNEDEIAVKITGNVMKIGHQEVELPVEFLSHLLDSAFGEEVALGIKPDYVTMEETVDSLALKAKIEFVEQKTDYQAVFFSLEGLPGYFAMKVKNDERVDLGKKVTVYLPLSRISIYDKAHNKADAKEEIFRNSVAAQVTNRQGSIVIKAAGATLVYPQEEIRYPDGNYLLTFKQDKLMTLFPNKMVKKGYQNPDVPDIHNAIKVSAYDEEVLGDKLLVYVQVPGIEKYASFVVNNNFSVYKLSKFSLYVPEDGFELEPLE